MITDRSELIRTCSIQGQFTLAFPGKIQEYLNYFACRDFFLFAGGSGSRIVSSHIRCRLREGTAPTTNSSLVLIPIFNLRWQESVKLVSLKCTAQIHKFAPLLLDGSTYFKSFRLHLFNHVLNSFLPLGNDTNLTFSPYHLHSPGMFECYSSLVRTIINSASRHFHH